MNFTVGDCFSDINDLEKRLEDYKRVHNVDFFKSDTKSLTAAKRTVPKRVENALPELKYYYLKYRCVHGGKRNTKGTGQRMTG